MTRRELLHDCLSVQAVLGAHPALRLILLTVELDGVQAARLFTAGSDEYGTQIVERGDALKLLSDVHSSSTTRNCGASIPSARCRPSASRATRSTLPLCSTSMRSP